MKCCLLFGCLVLGHFFGKSQNLDSLAAVKTVDSLIQISRGLTANQKFDEALKTSATAEKLALEKLGRGSAAFGSCCHNHGRTLFFKGDYLESEKWSTEALAIREKALGKNHPDYANSLMNLGNPYMGMGNFEKAEPLYLEAKLIYEKVFGKESPQFAGSLTNLANLYSAMGNYEKAISYYLQSLELSEKASGRETPGFANTLNNLGLNYTTIGNFKKAEENYLESLAIREKTVGKNHPDYAASLHNLAHLYDQMGNPEKAEPLYLESLASIEKSLGKSHPDYATNLYNFANLYLNLEKYEKARPLYDEALAIRGKILGKKNLFYANCLSGLANLSKATGDDETARRLFTEFAEVSQTVIANALHHLSERELNSYLATFSTGQNQILSFAETSKKNLNFSKNGIEKTCFDNSLFYKGFLLVAAAQIKNLTISNAAATEKSNLLKSCERQLATRYAQPIAQRDSTKIANLEAQKNELEKDLARTVAGYGEATRQVRWQDVQAVLKPGEAAVEFVNFSFYEKKLTDGSRAKSNDSTVYAALVLRPGMAAPVFVPLFEMRELTEVLQRPGNDNFQKTNELYNFSTAGTGRKTLFDLIWKPLEKDLAGVQKLYVSPSGLLHKINLAAIPIGKKEVFSDRHQLILVGSTRQLVANFQSTKNASNDAHLVGGVRYSMDSTVISMANFTRSRGLPDAGELTFFADSTRGEKWNYLPETAREVLEINGLLKNSGIEAQLDTGFVATEESFRSLGVDKISPKIIHVATHGFFFPVSPRLRSATALNDRARRLSGVEAPVVERSRNEPIFKISEHPMIRTGLILAGGNQAWTGKKTPAGLQDGILTAYEISQMNLSGTELVVLSACETGLGDIEGNEGVYGLQRAFKIAGAKYLIVSLWKVGDRATRELMTEFYKKWLAEKMEIPDAFRAAQATMRLKYIGEPFQWAGFVLME